MWRLERLKHGPNLGKGRLSMLCRFSTTKTRDVSSFQHPAFTPTCFVALASWGVGCMHVWSCCCFHTFPFSELKLRVQDLWRYPAFLMWWRFPFGSFCAEKWRMIFVGRVYLHSHFLSFLSNKPILKISEVGGGGFTNMFFFTPIYWSLGKIPIFTHIFFNWVVQPPTTNQWRGLSNLSADKARTFPVLWTSVRVLGGLEPQIWKKNSKRCGFNMSLHMFLHVIQIW